MIVFECPSCKAKMRAAEEYAGQTVVCPDCNAPTTIPASAETPVKAAPTTPPPAPAATAEAISAEPVVTTAAAAPPPKPDAITTPEHGRSTMKSRDDDDDRDVRPRRRDSSDTAVATGMSVGLIVLLVVGIGGCALVGVGAILVALLVPAVQKVREAAARTQTMNNMKQIALANKSHHDVFKKFPSPQMQPMQAGMKPPDLSWRVAILPYIEQQNMFNQFDKNSAWDHPNNSPFLNSMPMQYQHVSRPAPNNSQTTFQYFTGPGTMFPDPQSRMTLAEIIDGASNTFMFAEAQTPVPWSKPADMAVMPNAPLPLPADQFLAAMADGSVRMVNRPGVSDQTLRLLIDPRAGQQLPMDWDR